MHLLHLPEFRFVRCWDGEQPSPDFAGQGHYQRGFDVADALSRLEERNPSGAGAHYRVDTREAPWKPPHRGLLLERFVAQEAAVGAQTHGTASERWPIERLRNEVIVLNQLRALVQAYPAQEAR